MSLKRLNRKTSIGMYQEMNWSVKMLKARKMKTLIMSNDSNLMIMILLLFYLSAS